MEKDYYPARGRRGSSAARAAFGNPPVGSSDVSFELTINRVGIFAGALPAVRYENAEALDAAFVQQLEFILGSADFRSARRIIRLQANKYRSLRPNPEDEVEETHLRIRQLSAAEGGDEGTLVGTLPSHKFRFTTVARDSQSERIWIVQARASVTSCALHPGERDAKLWWTFEGVPADENPLRRPSGDDIAAFVEATDRLADAVIEPLYKAYRAAVAEQTQLGPSDLKPRGSRLRIRMSDSNDREVEALFNAVYSWKLDVTDIQKLHELGPARKGLAILEKFVSDVAHTRVDIQDNSLRTAGVAGGLKGIYYQRIEHDGDIIVAGLGQKSGSILGLESSVAPRKLRGGKSEGYLRAMSASRPISAIVADEEAASPEPAP